jgi:pyruvate/2-oxoacid:ferredoxin oxidoreductase alpha subunit
MRQLCKGNVAVIKGAVLAGCRAYYGYPITPASEVAEAAALYFPEVGGTFVQAESETASINMVYGAASAGQRVMTASSGPGLSLMQEDISYLAGAELPCVIVDVMRGGQGLGNIAPEQSDYFARVEAVIRCYDPCLSCSTHAMGQMPLRVQLIGRGELMVVFATRGTIRSPNARCSGRNASALCRVTSPPTAVAQMRP